MLCLHFGMSFLKAWTRDKAMVQDDGNKVEQSSTYMEWKISGFRP